jgi:hypothetical protein
MATTNDNDSDTTASIDGEKLDEIARILGERHTERIEGESVSVSEQAITSGELADEVTGETADANPKTREAIKILMRERGIPVVGGSQGYWIPVDGDRVEDTLDSLDQRIAGIEERKQLLAENWRRWNSDGGSDGQTLGDVSIPQAVRECIGGGVVPRDDVVTTVAERCDESPEAVSERLDDLEANGFVYDAGDGLRLP